MQTQPVWRTGPQDGPRFERLTGRAEADVCVVGLGGSGLAAVAEAQRLGRSVIGLDAGEVACGAAGRNGGFLLAGTPDFHHRAVAALGRERAAAIYRLTLDEIERTPTARPVGSLRIADDADELEDCQALVHTLKDDGFEAEPYDGPEGQGVLMPADGAFDPLARCRINASATADRGARLHEHSPVTDLRAHRVQTAHGEVDCQAVVVCVDGGLERLLPELAPAVRTARLQMLATAPLPRGIAPRPVYARWGFDYWQQLPSGAVALGGCRDRFLDDEWTTDATPTPPVQACLDRLLRDRLHLAHAEVTHRWAGCAAFTPDHMPYLGQPRPGVVAAGGYCGTGNVLGVLCGRAAVRLALGLPLDELMPLQD